MCVFMCECVCMVPCYGLAFHHAPALCPVLNELAPDLVTLTKRKRLLKIKLNETNSEKADVELTWSSLHCNKLCFLPQKTPQN